jgi:glutathione S-transferase
MYTLYSMQRSGNSYKVRLALAHLRMPYRLVEIDILKGESRTPEFLAKNPNGQVPLLEAAPGRYLAESNAILWHLASGSRLRPENRIERAEALQWMFFEQHSIEPNIGSAYFWLTLVKGGRELQQHALEDWMEEGNRALGVMENHLKHNNYFAATRSPTSPSTPIRTWRMNAISTLLLFLPSAPGSRASKRSRIMCRWNGSP